MTINYINDTKLINVSNYRVESVYYKLAIAPRYIYITIVPISATSL